MEANSVPECERCGHCCLTWASYQWDDSDLSRWAKEGRLDIIYHPCVSPYSPYYNCRYDIIVAQDFGVVEELGITQEVTFRAFLLEKEQEVGLKFLWGGILDSCPFLKYIGDKKYSCLIHETKPRICAEFSFDQSLCVKSVKAK